ncbi:MAG TPA: hypothetical protein VG897_19280, partial [Terriglobales bacterium]|nr:hypothetical protein [Terriglobales bacterium]
LANLNEAGLKVDAWDPAKLFSAGDDSLKRAFGVLFKVPEIREELGEVTGGKGKDGDLLARIVKDWVAGASIPQLAADYFTGADGNQTEAITKACRAVYGKLTLTASWGLSALQSLTAGDAVEKMSESERRSFKNLPSQIYYGVSSDDAIDLRLLGVPRNAAQPLANLLKGRGVAGVQSMRTALNGLDEKSWNAALGPKGFIYQRAWKVLEGID